MSHKRRNKRASTRQVGKSEIYLEQAEYNGPVPMPKDLQEYEKIQPGFADRLIKMAEEEQKWRHSAVEKEQADIGKWNNKQQNIQILGQIMGLLSVILVVALCVYALYLNFDVTAKWIAISVIASLAAVFVIKRKEEKK